MNARLAKMTSAERSAQIQEQMLRELVEFLTPHPQLRDGSEAQNQGRHSGDEQWRRARGEMGGSGGGEGTSGSTEQGKAPKKSDENAKTAEKEEEKKNNTE